MRLAAPVSRIGGGLSESIRREERIDSSRGRHIRYVGTPGCAERACPAESLQHPTESGAESLVGATGFEPATCGSQNRRATKLRHAPLKLS